MGNLRRVGGLRFIELRVIGLRVIGGLRVIEDTWLVEVCRLAQVD